MTEKEQKVIEAEVVDEKKKMLIINLKNLGKIRLAHSLKN